MLARPVPVLPDTPEWAFEPKVDGFRALLTVTSDGRISLISRHGKSLSRYFPEITDAAGQLPRGLRLDGELVVPRAGGVDFGALQGRIHPVERRVLQLAKQSPAAFVAFDLLTLDGYDLREQTYRTRRGLLAPVLSGVSPVLGVIPMTTDPDAARTWLSGQLPGIEGVVAKRLDQRYRPGVRGWLKVRIRHSAEAIVGGVMGPIERPEALILGRPNSRGQLRAMARSGKLATPERTRIGSLLRTPVGRHPWPLTLPSGRFGSIPGNEVAYTQVEPELIVEFEHDTAAERGGQRHAVRFIRTRPDLEPSDLEPWA